MKVRWILAAFATLLVAALLWMRSDRRRPELPLPSEVARDVTTKDLELSSFPASDSASEAPLEQRASIELTTEPDGRVRKPKASSNRAPDVSFVRGHVRYVDWSPARDVEVALLPKTLIHQPLWRTLEADLAGCRTDARGAFRVEGVVPGEYFARARESNDLIAVSEPFTLWPGKGRLDLDLILTRGCFVSGTVAAPPGASCAGLIVSLAPDRPMHAESFGSQELAPDGRFDLGPIPPGRCAVHLKLPQTSVSKTISLPTGKRSRAIAIVELRDGERLERDFEVQDFPGTITLEVLVNGRAAPDVALGLWTEDHEPGGPFTLHGDTDARGNFGPAHAFPGSWRLVVGDLQAGWRYTNAEPLLVGTASETWARIQVTVADGTVTFLDAENGERLRQRMIYVLGPEGDGPITRRKTDAEGRIHWTLAAGDYRFRLEPVGVEITNSYRGMPTSIDPAHTVPFTWTSEGPVASEVRL